MAVAEAIAKWKKTEKRDHKKRTVVITQGPEPVLVAIHDFENEEENE